MTRTATLGWLVLAACSAPPPAPVVAEVRVAVVVEFEPPLREPGELHYAHECGERGTVRTQRSGVSLSLPVGPVALTLRADGIVREWVLRVVDGMPPARWGQPERAGSPASAGH